MSHFSMRHLSPARAVLYFNADDNAGTWHLLACSGDIWSQWKSLPYCLHGQGLGPTVVLSSLAKKWEVESERSSKIQQEMMVRYCVRLKRAGGKKVGPLSSAFSTLCWGRVWSSSVNVFVTAEKTGEREESAVFIPKFRCGLRGKWFADSGSWSVWCYPDYCNLQDSFNPRLPGNAKCW